MWGDDADSSDEEMTEVSGQKNNKFMKKVGFKQDLRLKITEV